MGRVSRMPGSCARVTALIALIPFCAGAAPGRAEPTGDMVELPSGLRASLQEMIWNRPGQGLTYRFRFVAEGFAETDDIDQVMADLHYLCTHYALDRLSVTGPAPRQVVISLADRASEFGTYDPDVTQVFEAYRIEEDACIWEVF